MSANKVHVLTYDGIPVFCFYFTSTCDHSIHLGPV